MQFRVYNKTMHTNPGPSCSLLYVADLAFISERRTAATHSSCPEKHEESKAPGHAYGCWTYLLRRDDGTEVAILSSKTLSYKAPARTFGIFDSWSQPGQTAFYPQKSLCWTHGPVCLKGARTWHGPQSLINGWAPSACRKCMHLNSACATKLRRIV